MEKLGLGCAHVGATTLLSGLTNMGLLNSAAAANKPAFSSPNMMDYKALVGVLLGGGNDSFNMLVPLDDEPYEDYRASRTTVALPKEDLLPLDPTNTGGRRFGLHPNMPKLQALFNEGHVSFVANCGVLQEPTTLEQYNRRENLPIGLFSHSHQSDRWQTSLPREVLQSEGWGGRLADVLQQNNENQDVSLSIALGSSNLFQRGRTTQSYTINNTDNGSILINGSNQTNFYETLKRATLDDILEVNHQNILKNAYADLVTGSRTNGAQFGAAIASGQSITTSFGRSSLDRDLRMVARTIAARDLLQMSRQSFFILARGFDNHDDVLSSHGGLMARLDDGLSSFFEAMLELGVADQVTLFTMSDFGRKLITNGDGTDHAWGGNALTMGGAVNGGRIYGEYPDLYLGSSLDTGGGRFVPTTSADEYFAELALWFGASGADLEYILPNLENFWDYRSGGTPLGFLS